MFVVGIGKDNNIVNIDDKVPEDVFKDFVCAWYHTDTSITVALLYDATALISHVYEEGGVLF